jgi:hypothetical protein
MKKSCLASMICCSLGSDLNSNLDHEAMDVGILPNQLSDVDTTVMIDTNSGMFNPCII